MLMAAASAIPGIGSDDPACAQNSPAPGMLKFSYGVYEDYQSGGKDRMQIKAPQIWFRSPFGGRSEFEGYYVVDSMSGASPLYHNTLSGASGIGVEDDRIAADGKLTHYFEDFSLGLGLTTSSEDDYNSRGASIEARFWSADKNTTYTISASAGDDDITSSIDGSFQDSRDVLGILAGVTQTINRRSLLQSNITYTNSDGYFSDPYKPLDNRPRSRDQFSWLNRYRLFVPSIKSSLHADYRLYLDSWGVLSHMLEVALYKTLGETWAVRPSLRYYTQRRADFFSSTFPPRTEGGFYSADQRISDFGSITPGIKIVKEFADGWLCDVSFDFVIQDPDLKLGSARNSPIDSFYARIFSAGIAKKF